MKKHIFTRAQRNELIKVFTDELISGTPAGVKASSRALAEFLDQFTQPPLPDHVLLVAKSYVLEQDEWDEITCDNFNSCMRALYGDDWDRALEETDV